MQLSADIDLTWFTAPQDEVQLQRLDAYLSTISPDACGDQDCMVLLDVFERFPDDDGYGVFWTVLHLLEACAGCEAALLASIKRQPTKFSLLMLNRMLNGGKVDINGESVLNLLMLVAKNEEVAPAVRESADGFIQYQLKRQRQS